MSKASDFSILSNLAEGLASVTQRLDPKEGSVVCNQAALLLIQTMNKTSDSYTLSSLSDALSSVTRWLDPKEASLLCEQTASLLFKTICKTTDSGSLSTLSRSLSSVAQRLEPKEAASLLIQTMNKTSNFYALRFLSEGLASVVQRFDPKEALVACHQTASLLIQTMSNTSYKSDVEKLMKALRITYTQLDRIDLHQRLICLTTSSSLFLNPHLPITSISLLQPAIKPIPCRLTDQELVDWLKHPLCVNDARRVMLDFLGERHGQKFNTQWDFVRFAQEKNLPVDLKSPPPRLSDFRISEKPELLPRPKAR